MFNTMKYARKIRQYAKNEIYLQYKEKSLISTLVSWEVNHLYLKTLHGLIIQEKTLMVS